MAPEQRALLSGSPSWVRKEQCSSTLWTGRFASRTKVLASCCPRPNGPRLAAISVRRLALGKGLALS